MPDTTIKYVRLSELFPSVSRPTLYRWRRTGKVPKPDLVVGNREFWIERPLAPSSEVERRPATAEHRKPETA